MDHSPHSSPFPRESTLTQSTILHSLPLTRFPPNSSTSPYPSTLKHVSHSHFYQCPPSLKNEPILARSPSCLGVSPSFLAPTFILLNPSKRTFNHPSIPFPSREIPPNLFHFRPPNRPLFHPIVRHSPFNRLQLLHPRVFLRVLFGACARCNSYSIPILGSSREGFMEEQSLFPLHPFLNPNPNPSTAYEICGIPTESQWDPTGIGSAAKWVKIAKGVQTANLVE